MIRRAAALVVLGLVAAGDASSTARTTCPAGTGLASLAYVKGGALLLLDMPACSRRTLVTRGAAGPVRWSADGRFVSYSGGVVSAVDGWTRRGMRGVWAPAGHALAVVTPRGGLALGGPGLTRHRLLPQGFGVQSVAFDPAGGRLAVSRAQLRGTAIPLRREIWVVHLPSATARLVYRVPPGDRRTPMLAGWAPGGHVLFTLRLLPALSANLDGVPLHAVPADGGRVRRVVPAALTYDEFLTACGTRIAVTSGADRVTTRNKRVVLAAPPLWRARDVTRDRARSWLAPSCSPDGRWIAASAGPSRAGARFGLERRSIWLLSADGRTRRRLTAPPPGRSDELPRWSSDGRALLFVRTGPTKGDATARGLLYVVRLDGSLGGPLSHLGTSRNYYGRYGWAEQTDLDVVRR